MDFYISLPNTYATHSDHYVRSEFQDKLHWFPFKIYWILLQSKNCIEISKRVLNISRIMYSKNSHVVYEYHQIVQWQGLGEEGSKLCPFPIDLVIYVYL